MRPRRSTLTALTILLLGGPALAVAQRVTALTLSANSVIGGQGPTGQVSLSGPAPAGGLVVQLSSTNPAVAYPAPASVTVPQGARTQKFTVRTVPVGQSTAVTIGAFAGGESRTALLNVRALLSSVTLADRSVRGGFGTKGVVRVSEPAPAGGLVVLLSSADPEVATVPGSATIPAGAVSGTFDVLAVPVSRSATVSISAAVDGVHKTAQLTVEAPALLSLVFGPASLRGGAGTTGEVELTGRAPSGGFAVALSSGDPAVVTMAGDVIVPAGATTVRFPVATRRVTKPTIVKLTASANGVFRSQEVAVNP